jgi:hypothetical protein
MMTLVFRYEIEHVFSEFVYKDDDRLQLLEKVGIFQQSRMNLLGLFSEPVTVHALQNASPQLQSLLEKAGWGKNRHDQRNFPDTFQAGKNGFLRLQFDEILAITDPEAQKFAVLELFQWTLRLANGDIRDANGNVVPVQGSADIYTQLFDSIKIGVEGFADPNNAAAQARMEELATLAESIKSGGTVPQSSESNDPMRREAVKVLAEKALAEGVITLEQYDQVVAAADFKGKVNDIPAATAAATILFGFINN